jgi:hypothetical protein
MDFDGAFSRFTTTMLGTFMRARVISERYAQIWTMAWFNLTWQRVMQNFLLLLSMWTMSCILAILPLRVFSSSWVSGVREVVGDFKAVVRGCWEVTHFLSALCAERHPLNFLHALKCRVHYFWARFVDKGSAGKFRAVAAVWHYDCTMVHFEFLWRARGTS